MELLDSRRLTGPGLLLDREGAALEVSFAPEEEVVVTLWQERARHLLDALGWGEETIAVRRFPGGASLAITAPFDALFAACDVAEAAWTAATAAQGGEPEPDFASTLEALRAAIEAERDPQLVELRDAAEAHGVTFLIDDKAVTVGLGTGSRTFPRRERPEEAVEGEMAVSEQPSPSAPLPEGEGGTAKAFPLVSPLPLGEGPGVRAELDPYPTIDWSPIHDVPHAVVTGTNGKTTTVRLLASIGRAAGFVVGLSSTDGVEVGGARIATGDYSGPEGAKKALRDTRVELGVLELARGGLLRRGVPLSRATAAAVTNVAADHLGEYGVFDVPSLAEAKLSVAHTLLPGGRLVLSADDPELASRGRAVCDRFGLALAWFSLSPTTQPLADHISAGYTAAFLEGDALILAHGKERTEVIRVTDLPLAYGGAARHNLSNALTAIALADALGISLIAMREGLAAVGTSPADNPGRANLIPLTNGAAVLLDYAHNPHGLEALRPLVLSLPAKRRILLFGQAGDRDDDALRDLAAAAARFKPDLVILKEMPALLRGRQPGEVPAILDAELRRLGVPEIRQVETELAGVELALEVAGAGDLLILLVHTDRKGALERIGAA
ncbi:MAG TPA: Mur ligase family protein [Thermoanaerobaculia bacterium]|jgi:UDP-N-acetylmuramyl tripeptide synthase|nr:Mur ligase family protein [Thermoanaerobaculia bacterium]